MLSEESDALHKKHKLREGFRIRCSLTSNTCMSMSDIKMVVRCINTSTLLILAQRNENGDFVVGGYCATFKVNAREPNQITIRIKERNTM